MRKKGEWEVYDYYNIIPQEGGKKVKGKNKEFEDKIK